MLNFMHSFPREKNAAPAAVNPRTFLLVAQPAKLGKKTSTQGKTSHKAALTEYSTNASRQAPFCERWRYKCHLADTFVLKKRAGFDVDEIQRRGDARTLFAL
ncbi:hypothetical protein ACI3L3_05260 [Desulfobaculum sp. SPO524]|uniref:hypothetical protein n=1 Tax=Desulfobaculum sp. SPO524 TaxID=3378071 RepID=UPI003853C5E9